VRRLFSYNRVTQDEQGKVELCSFSNDRSNTFALLGDHLIVASTTGVSIYSSSGSVVDSMSVKLTNPAIAVGGQTAAVYDIGGQTLLIYSASGLVRDMSGECSGNILSVSVNSSDYLALNAEKSGYKSAVTVYDASGEKTFAFNSSEHYVIDAVVMRDCKRMAAVTLGESDGTFADTVSIYSLGSDKADSVNTLTGSLLLSLDSVAGTLSCLTDESLTLFSSDGTLSGSYRYEYPYLRGSSMDGDNYAALAVRPFSTFGTSKNIGASVSTCQMIAGRPRSPSLRITPTCLNTEPLNRRVRTEISGWDRVTLFRVRLSASCATVPVTKRAMLKLLVSWVSVPGSFPTI
jgi:hypothetical protein